MLNSFIFSFSCAKLEEEENKSETTSSLGDKNGDAVKIDGYDYNGNKEISATITPYERGLKILFSLFQVHLFALCQITLFKVVLNSNSEA